MKKSENTLQKGTSHKVQLFHAVNEAHKKWEIKKQNTCKPKKTRNSIQTAEKVWFDVRYITNFTFPLRN